MNFIISYNTLSIPNLHKYQLLFVHKFIHHPELLPEVFNHSNFFTFNEEIHNTRTKDKLHLHLYHSSTTSGLRSVRHKAAVLGNDLPSSLQQIESLSVFKNHLRYHLLSNT